MEKKNISLKLLRQGNSYYSKFHYLLNYLYSICHLQWLSDMVQLITYAEEL